LFKDIEHLIRLAVVMAIALTAFMILRAAVVPRSFGQYGYYRGLALAEIASRPIAFAGHVNCETCHSDVVAVKNEGKHAGVNCEVCHGALAKHAEDPGTVQPPKLDTAVLCVRCHEVNGARPRDFPQIVAKEHSTGLPCETCHQPHSPVIGAGAKP
jgi:uncharacterized CHY-type Zn-finger protein